MDDRYEPVQNQKKNPRWQISFWLTLSTDTTEPSASARSALLRSLPVEKQDVGCLWLDRDMELVWHYRTWCLYRDWESRSKEEDHVDTDSLKAELRTWMDMLDFPHVAEGFSVIVKPSFKVRTWQPLLGALLFTNPMDTCSSLDRPKITRAGSNTGIDGCKTRRKNSSTSVLILK